MDKEIIQKKLEQISALVRELTDWTNVEFDSFDKSTTTVRACERNFELLVELTADINALLVQEKLNQTPDNYRQSFELLVSKLSLFSRELLKIFLDSVKLRNALVHEYEFETDNRKFYDSLKRDFIPGFTEYVKAIVNFVS